jgi:alpha-galactosidase
MRPTLPLLAVLLFAPLALLHAAEPTTQENAVATQWAQANVFGDKAKLPFSFTLGGKSSDALLRNWKRTDAARQLDTQRREYTRTWLDAASGLEVRLVATEYAGFPVAEWTVWLKNTGKAATAIIEDIQGLDFKFERESKGEFVLHGIRGDSAVAESYKPNELKLGPDTAKRCSPPAGTDRVSGKSSDGPDGWPYWNLQQPGGGMILAVGWPGQWQTSFTRDHDRGLRIKAGQQLTHLTLKPGEEIRTPSTTLLFWQGEDLVRAQNLWRTWYIAHVLPRTQGKPQPPATRVNVGGAMKDWSKVQEFIDAGIKPDICWRDAGADNTWWPVTNGPPRKPGKGWHNTGTWEIDRAKYPEGFRPFSDKARQNGLQFMLWFEPERVGDPNSSLGKNHPEWLIPLPVSDIGSVVNLGDPAALKWFLERIDGMVKSEGLDWYREDMNGGNYGTAWRRHDAPDRQGITENFHVQGHLMLWDELRRRNPNLRIDSCASGGRRNDLETMRRSVPMLRSDFNGDKENPLLIEANQSQTYGLSSWLPYQGVSVGFKTDSYSVRSHYLTSFGIVLGEGWSKNATKRAGTIRGYAEARRIAPLLLGDYYPLTPYALDTQSWIAWQFHHTDLGEGVVQAFRRPEATSETLTVKLRGLIPEQRYEVENFDGGKEVRTGAELIQGHVITLREKPGSAVLLIKAVK